MKQNWKMLILVILSMISWIWLSYALNVTQTINNTVAYIQKMVFTIDGTDNTTEKLVIDGSNGSITMSGELNIQKGALKDNTISWEDLMNWAVTWPKLSNDIQNLITGTVNQVADNTTTVTSLSGWRHNLYQNNAAILQVYANTSGADKNIWDHTYCFSIDGGTISIVDKSSSGNDDINYDNSNKVWVLKNNKMALCGDSLNY